MPEPVAVTPADPMLTTAVLLLLQVPPPVTSDKNPVAPIQALVDPVIGDGVEFTVTGETVRHPDEFKTKVISELPADTPLTVPEVPIVATLVLLLVHVPAPDKSVRFVELPEQKVVVPEIEAGAASTVTTAVMLAQGVV